MDYEHLWGLLMVGGVSLLAAISPGPDFLIVVRNSLAHSRKAGIYTAVGISLGLLIHLTYTLVGLAVLIIQSPMIYNAMKYAGAAYLGYLGFSALVSTLKPTQDIELTDAQSTPDVTPWAMIRQGFLTNALNPKCAVFFVSLFSQFITVDTSVALRLEYAFVNWSVTFVWFVFLSCLMTGQLLTSKLGKFRSYTDRVMGTLLILISVKMLFV